MGQLSNSFIRGFGSTLGRAAAKKAMQGGGPEISGKRVLITVLILLVGFLGILKLSSNWSKDRQSRFIVFNAKGEDNKIGMCYFSNSKGKNLGIASVDLFERVDGHPELIPDSLQKATESIYISEPKEEFVTIKSDGYEDQIVKVDNRDTINVTLRKIK